MASELKIRLKQRVRTVTATAVAVHMKSLLVATAILACTAGPATPQTVETIPFRAVLLATNEPSPVVDKTATGAATIWLHVVRDTAGKVTSGSLDFSVSYKFAGSVTLTANHIHKGPAGVAGPIMVPVALTQFTDAKGRSEERRVGKECRL